MRIDLHLPTTNSAETSRTDHAGKSAKAAQPDISAEQQSVDTASLSSLSAQVQAAPEVRSERVSALRQQVQSGDYKVDAGKVADAMLKDQVAPAKK